MHSALYSPLTGLHEGVVVRVTDATDRRLNPLESEAFGERYRCILTARVRVADQQFRHRRRRSRLKRQRYSSDGPKTSVTAQSYFRRRDRVSSIPKPP